MSPKQSSPSSSRPNSIPSILPSVQPTPYSDYPWHKAEYFVAKPGKKSRYYVQILNQIKFVKEKYGGDLAVLHGDTNGALPGEKGGGHWDTVEFMEKFKSNYTVKRRVIVIK